MTTPETLAPMHESLDLVRTDLNDVLARCNAADDALVAGGLGPEAMGRLAAIAIDDGRWCVSMLSSALNAIETFAADLVALVPEFTALRARVEQLEAARQSAKVYQLRIVRPEDEPPQ